MCSNERMCPAGCRMPGAAKVVPRGLEPRTLRLLAVRSNQLSYETSWEQFAKDAREELLGVQIFCAGSCGSVWLQSWRSKGE